MLSAACGCRLNGVSGFAVFSLQKDGPSSATSSPAAKFRSRVPKQLIVSPRDINGDPAVAAVPAPSQASTANTFTEIIAPIKLHAAASASSGTAASAVTSLDVLRLGSSGSTPTSARKLAERLSRAVQVTADTLMAAAMDAPSVVASSTSVVVSTTAIGALISSTPAFQPPLQPPPACVATSMATSANGSMMAHQNRSPMVRVQVTPLESHGTVLSPLGGSIPPPPPDAAPPLLPETSDTCSPSSSRPLAVAPVIESPVKADYTPASAPLRPSSRSRGSKDGAAPHAQLPVSLPPPVTQGIGRDSRTSSSSQSALPAVRMEGYLDRFTNRLRGWVRRYYVLSQEERSLAYYKTADSLFPSSFLPLSDILEVVYSPDKHKGRVFSVCAVASDDSDASHASGVSGMRSGDATANRQVWKFQAMAPVEAAEWVSMIRKAMDAVRESNALPHLQTRRASVVGAVQALNIKPFAHAAPAQPLSGSSVARGRSAQQPSPRTPRTASFFTGFWTEPTLASGVGSSFSASSSSSSSLFSKSHRGARTGGSRNIGRGGHSSRDDASRPPLITALHEMRSVVLVAEMRFHVQTLTVWMLCLKCSPLQLSFFQMMAWTRKHVTGIDADSPSPADAAVADTWEGLLLKLTSDHSSPDDVSILRLILGILIGALAGRTGLLSHKCVVCFVPVQMDIIILSHWTILSDLVPRSIIQPATANVAVVARSHRSQRCVRCRLHSHSRRL